MSARVFLGKDAIRTVAELKASQKMRLTLIMRTVTGLVAMLSLFRRNEFYFKSHWRMGKVVRKMIEI